jgi:hypothetical protein
MTGPDSDGEFDDFLARRSPLHRRLADGDGHEPPAELDRIVLAKAREAIKRPSETPVYRSPQWALPVGLAASVLLTFAVVLNFARLTPQPGMATAPMAANAPAAAPAAESERAHPSGKGSAGPLAGSKAEADAVPAAALASRDALLAKEAAAPPSALRAEQEAPPSAPPVAGNVSSPPLASIASRAKPAEPSVEVRAARNTTQSSASTSAIAVTESKDVREFIAGGNILAGSPIAAAAEPAGVPPAAPVVAQAASPAESSDTSSSTLLAENGAQAAVSDQSARSDAAKRAYTASNTASPGAAATIGGLEEATVTGARRVRGGTKRPSTSSAPAAIAAEKARHPDADAWLREIEALRGAGRDADARRELEAFRKAYPDHPVPLSKDEPPPAE